MTDFEQKLTRGVVLKSVGLALMTGSLVGCGQAEGQSPQPVKLVNPNTANRVEDQKPKNLEHRITEAALKLARDRLNEENGLPHAIAKLYLDLTPLSSISPTFNHLTIGLVSDQVFSRLSILDAYQTSKFHMVQLETIDNKPIVQYPLYEKVNPQVQLSAAWLNKVSDEVKWLAMMKEASHLLMWPQVVQLGKKITQSIIKFRKLDPKADDRMIDDTFWINFSTGNSYYLVMFDLAGILAIWPYLKGLMEGAEDKRRGIAEPELDHLYNQAKKRDLDFSSISFNSERFINLAFNGQGEWFKLLKDVYPDISELSPLHTASQAVHLRG